MSGAIKLESEIDYWPAFLKQEEHDALYTWLSASPLWRQDKIKVFGKTHLIPRLQQFIAEQGVSYTYSGFRMTGQGFPDEITTVKQRVENACFTHFNAILANQYRSGQDSMGWHADDEPELGPDPCVAILSLGATRTLRFRAINKDASSWGVDLEAGSLLIMKPGSQARWQHSLPKRNRIARPRISLTFRNIRH